MSLLREIQHAATDPNTSVSALLLKCQLLTARVDHPPLREWVDRELNGYRKTEELPDYRKIGHVTVLGTLTGPFGSSVQNMPIPATIVDKRHWEDLFLVQMSAGIAGYEDLAASTEGSLQEKWPAHYIQHYAQKPITQNGMHLVDAWKVIPKGAIVSMLSTVRSRVLTLATELERLNPDAGDAVTGTVPLPTQSLQQLTANIYGGNLIAPAGAMVNQSGSVVGASSGGDLTTTSTHVEGNAEHVATTSESHASERNWFARHPWISGTSVGVLTGLIPAVYLALLGPHWP